MESREHLANNRIIPRSILGFTLLMHIISGAVFRLVAALVMLSKILLRCLLEMVLMHMCRRAKGNKTIPTSLNCDCTCLGLDDKTYNFAPLARDSGKPRFAKYSAK